MLNVFFRQLMSALGVITPHSLVGCVGKATFFKYFVQHACFITGGLHPGSLANTSLDNDNWRMGLLAFLRLIGTACLFQEVLFWV